MASNTFADRIKIPVLQTASREVGNIVSTGVQKIKELDLPSVGTKIGEAVSKAVKTGTLPDFSALSPTTKLAEVKEGVISLIDRGTKDPIADLLDTIGEGTPANLIPLSGRGNTEAAKVILKASPGGLFGPGDIDEIIFNVMPKISETRSIEFDQNTPLHHPGAIMKYKTTGARTWSLNGRFISRTRAEATTNRYYMNLIRAWAMPFYGTGSAKNPIISKYLGAPPPVITMTAFGDSMIGPVKTVMTTYSWDFPDDVDYIDTLDGEPFPVIFNVNISLTETYSPAEYSAFDIMSYRRGDLSNSFSIPIVPTEERAAINTIDGSSSISSGAGSTDNIIRTEAKSVTSGGAATAPRSNLYDSMLLTQVGKLTDERHAITRERILSAERIRKENLPNEDY